jgi:hypothetical protein
VNRSTHKILTGSWNTLLQGFVDDGRLAIDDNRLENQPRVGTHPHHLIRI